MIYFLMADVFWVMYTIFRHYDYLAIEIWEKGNKELYRGFFGYYNDAPLRVGAGGVDNLLITCGLRFPISQGARSGVVAVFVRTVYLPW